VVRLVCQSICISSPQCPSRQLLRYIYLASSLADFCSSTVGKSHGSGVTNCSVGTPSSNRRETALEKLNINVNQQNKRRRNIDKRNVLPEEQILIIRISLGVLLERLVLGQDVVGTKLRIPLLSPSRIQTKKNTHGNIMRDFVFLSSSCLGPFHFFQTHFSSNRSLK